MAWSALEPYGQPRNASPRDAGDVEDDGRWHVRLTDDDVKLMTLEQLDDAFRLSIVDADTALWKPGMREWQPLGIVAGLERDDDEVLEVDLEITTVGPSPHDATPLIPTRPLQKAPPPPSPVLRAPPPPPRPSMPPPAPPLRATQPPPPAFVPPARAASSTARPAAVAAAPVAPVTQAPIFPRAAAAARWQPISLPPVAQSMLPVPVPHPGSGWSTFGRWLLAIAFLAGTAVSLYRNDVLLQWARAAHLENQFLSAEQRLLGGPLFGMQRAIATSAELWEPSPLPNARETAQPAAEAKLPLTAAPATVADRPTAPATVADRPTAPATVADRPTAPATVADRPTAPATVAEPNGKLAVPVETRRAAPSARTTGAAVKPAVKPTSRGAVAQASAPSPVTPTSTPALAGGAKGRSPGALAVHLDEEPEPQPAKSRSKKPDAPPSSPFVSSTGASTGLDSAIRDAAARKLPKKKSTASEYDPLNPDL